MPCKVKAVFSSALKTGSASEGAGIHGGDGELWNGGRKEIVVSLEVILVRVSVASVLEVYSPDEAVLPGTALVDVGDCMVDVVVLGSDMLGSAADSWVAEYDWYWLVTLFLPPG